MEVNKNGIIYTVENNNFLKEKELIKSTKFYIENHKEQNEVVLYKTIYNDYLQCEYDDVKNNNTRHYNKNN